MDLKEEAILGGSIGSHWYYRSKAALVQRLLADRPPTTIMDVGAGSGFFSRQLLATTLAREAVCVDTGYAEDHDEEVSGKPLRFRRDPGDIRPDVMLLMDVLEHVPDDRRLLTDYVRRVSPGGRVVITVPAFRFLWSQHDVFLGHYRRYRLHEVEALVRSAGLEVVVCAYYFGLVFPIAAARRLAARLARGSHSRSELSRHSTAVNRLLGAVCHIELPFAAWNRVVGLSVCCLARVPSGPSR